MNRYDWMTMDEVQTFAGMINEARDKGFWFYCTYFVPGNQRAWLSPDDLERYWDDNLLKFGPRHFQLRDPREREAELLKVVEQAEAELAAFRERVKNANASTG